MDTDIVKFVQPFFLFLTHRKDCKNRKTLITTTFELTHHEIICGTLFRAIVLKGN